MGNSGCLYADSVEQIRGALHFAGKEQLEGVVIVGGSDAWRVADELKDAGASVILGPVNGLPSRRWEAFDTAYVAAGKLHAAGIPFCIAQYGSSFRTANTRNLPYEAARAVAHGLPKEIALRAVTLFPAQILGLGDRLGSLEEGKEATFFISDGDPLEVMTTIEAAYIAGRKIDLSSKQTRLFEKYREKYRQLGEEVDE